MTQLPGKTSALWYVTPDRRWPNLVKTDRWQVIKPESMEQLDLSDPTKAYRHVYTFEDASGEWKFQECWP